MVNVDTVYQRVLAIANKEQRGYITPQEFNLFANQAQLDIFEQYFYDVNQFSRIPGNETETSDMIDLLDEKLDIFEVKNGIVAGGETLPINPPIYRLGSIFFNGVEVERINEKEWAYRRSSILTHPKNSRPIYIPNGNGQISAFGDSTVDPIGQDLPCNYIRRPGRAQWGYMVVNGYAQYNITTSNDFELHASEETNLTLKILQLAGLVMKDVGLYQTMAQEEIKDIQQEKQ